MCVDNSLAKSILQVLLLLCLFLFPQAASAKNHPLPEVFRWQEGHVGCTFDRTEDSKYNYRISTDSWSLVLSVDSQELEKVRRRVTPFLAFHLVVHYRGSDSVDFDPHDATVEFRDHYHRVHPALDPDDLETDLQLDMEALGDETRRTVRRKPERKEEEEKLLQAQLRDVAEMQEFVASQGLRPATLDSVAPEVSGWILFSTRSKWIGRLKKREHVLVRIPLSKKAAAEFPLILPPENETLLLRTRPAN